MKSRLSALYFLVGIEMVFLISALSIYGLYLQSVSETADVSYAVASQTNSKDAFICAILAGMIMAAIAIGLLRSHFPPTFRRPVSPNGVIATILLIAGLTVVLAWPFQLMNELGAKFDVSLVYAICFACSTLATPWALDLSRWLDSYRHPSQIG